VSSDKVLTAADVTLMWHRHIMSHSAGVISTIYE